MARLMPNGKQQFFDTNGDPLNGGKVYTYSAGTSTPKDTYTTYAGTVANANPVILDSRGEATIFWSGSYKVVLKDSSDNTIWTVDNIDTSISASDVTFGSTTLGSFLLNNTVYVVDTINDLKAVDKTSFTHVFVNGYYKARDGGGGMYWYDSTDVSSTDNGGTVIVAADSGRWKLLHNGTVDLAQFGAKNYVDYPTTDSATYIQKAVDVCAASSTFEPKIGNLTCSNWYLIKTKVAIPESVHIEGTQDIDMLYADENYNGMPHTLFSSGFYFGGTSDGKIELEGRLSKMMFFPDGFTLENTGSGNNNNYTRTTAPIWIALTAGSTTSPTKGCMVDRCTIVGFDTYGIDSSVGVSDSTACTVRDTIVDCENGIYHNLESDLYCYNVIMPALIGAVPGEVHINGIYVSTASSIEYKVSIIGGQVKARVPVYIYAPSTGIDAIVEKVTITQAFSPAGSDYGIKFDSTGGTVIIRDNYISGTTTSIYIGDGTYTISDNKMDGAISISTSADYGVIRGNDTQDVTFGSTAVAKKCHANFERATFTPSDFTWTPVLKLAGSATGTTIGGTYAVYKLIDNIVYYHAYFQVTALNAGAGAADDVTIDGLPFTSAAGDAASPVGSCQAYYYSGGASLTGGIHGTILPSGTTITMYQGATTGTMTALEKQDLAVNMYLGISGFYFIDR